MKNILILNNHGLGDVVMSFDFIYNLLKSSSDRIIILFKSDLEIQLFKLSNIYSSYKGRFILLNKKNILELLKYSFRIRKAYSLNINLQKSILLFKILGVKKIYMAFPYNCNLSGKSILNNEKKIHKSELFCKLLEISNCVEYNELNIGNNYFPDYENKLKLKNYIVIACGSGKKEKLKRWTSVGYHILIKKILEYNKEIHVVFVGSKEEEDFIVKIIENFGNEYVRRIINLAGKTNLRELIGILKGSKVVIGSDNGILHIASACNCKIIGLFGPTDYKITGPKNAGVKIISSEFKCAPCYGKGETLFGCEDNKCMQQINSNYVFDIFMEVFDA
jgi:ADP-heptose:LPS heptosyltransferase